MSAHSFQSARQTPSSSFPADMKSMDVHRPASERLPGLLRREAHQTLGSRAGQKLNGTNGTEAPTRLRQIPEEAPAEPQSRNAHAVPVREPRLVPR